VIKAHQPGRSARKALDQRVIDGRATDDEKRRLLDLHEALAKAKPQKGSLDDWKRDTKALVEAVQGRWCSRTWWPACIDGSFPPQAERDSKRRLHDAIKVLNRNQKQQLMEMAGPSAGDWPRWRVRNACGTSPRLTPDCP
jgi:hypothetical protein